MIYSKDIFPVRIQWPATGESFVVNDPIQLDHQKPGWIIISSRVNSKSTEVEKDGGLQQDTSSTASESGSSKPKPAVSVAKD